MRAAATAAESSHYFGLREDPWQRKLEARVAELTGMQDALVFPTCTMANTTALMLGADPGTCVVTQQEAHVLVSEAGAGAALGGLLMSAVDTPGAMPPIAAWERALATGADTQRPPVRLFVLENTHNRSGGVALAVEYVGIVTALARRHGVGLHLDGARLFNAACALGLAPTLLARGFDTVSVSLNKAFGAPIAAALAGSTAAIERALVLRQRLGGGLRPIGPAAAVTLAGLQDFSHIQATHELACRLATGLASVPGLDVEQPPVRTNIVIVRVATAGAAPALCAGFAARGLLALPFGPGRIRFVVYRGITSTAIDSALDIVRQVTDAG